MRKHFYIISIVLFFFVSCRAETEVYTSLFKCTPIMDNPYGVCSHINRKGDSYEFDTRFQDIVMISAVGATFVRTDFDWNICQPKVGGPYNFEQHIAMMEPVSQQKLQMLGILWPPVLSRPNSQYIEYVKKNVAKYKKSVKYWEVVNEADQLNKRRGDFTPDTYVRTLHEVNKIVKKENRHAKVLCSSIDFDKNLFFEKVFEAGAAKNFDILNIHWYANLETRPENLIGYLKWIQSLCAKYGVKKNAWLTETGCTSAKGFATEEIQAQRLPRIFLISFALGMEKVFWYKSRSCELSLDNNQDYYGLWHNDYTPKPVFYAYKTLTKICPDKSTRPKLERNDNIYIASWKRPDNIKVWAMWTQKGEENVVLDIQGRYTCYDLNGNTFELNDNNYIVSPNLIYIVGAKNVQIKNR